MLSALCFPMYVFVGADSLDVCFVVCCVHFFQIVSISLFLLARGGATNQRGYIVTGIPRHRSHFGSRYKLGCCGHAGLFHARFDDRHCRQKVFQKDCFKIRAVWSKAPASGKSCSTCVGLNPTSVVLRLHTYSYMTGIKPSRIIQRNWSLADPSSSGLLWHFGD